MTNEREEVVMLQLQTAIEGKQSHYGHVKDIFEQNGYFLGGNWDYDRGSFDGILWREGGETIYLRIPFIVIDGELDQFDAAIQFTTPYVIKHVVNIGLDRDESSLLTTTGLSQFQNPVDSDGRIHDRSEWEEIGELAVSQLLEVAGF